MARMTAARAAVEANHEAGPQNDVPLRRQNALQILRFPRFADERSQAVPGPRILGADDRWRVAVDMSRTIIVLSLSSVEIQHHTSCNSPGFAFRCHRRSVLRTNARREAQALQPRNIPTTQISLNEGFVYFDQKIDILMRLCLHQRSH